jgi:hypothetical protein
LDCGSRISSTQSHSYQRALFEKAGREETRRGRRRRKEEGKLPEA